MIRTLRVMETNIRSNRMKVPITVGRGDYSDRAMSIFITSLAPA